MHTAEPEPFQSDPYTAAVDAHIARIHAQADRRRQHAAALRERGAWWDHPRVFAWLVFALSLALVTVAGIVSLPGCTTPEQADASVALATRRIDELKAQEAAAAAKNDQTAADAARKRRETIEAAVAGVQGAKAAKPTETEQAAAGVAALVPGYGVIATAGIGLIGHLWRSGRLSSAVASLQRELGATTQDRDNLIDSIEDAKDQVPEFKAAFVKAAPIITRRQSFRTMDHVERVQKARKAKAPAARADQAEAKA